MAASKELKNVNDGLTQMIELVSKLENSFESLNGDIDKGLSAIEEQAKKTTAAQKKRNTTTDEGRKKIDAETKQAQTLIKAQKDLELSYKNNAVEILKVKKVKQDMVKIQKLEIDRGKGAIKSYKQLSAAYRLAAQRAKDLAVRYGENSKQARKAISAAKQYNDQLKRVDKSIGNSQRNVGNYTKGMDKLGKSLLTAGAGFLGFQTAIRVFKNIGKVVTEFSKAQSNLASVLGKTKKEITALTKDAKKYGAITAFTAAQVSDLQTELAKLGFKEIEIKASTKAVLDFAQATGAELGEAAKVSGAALRAFGLDASEMDRVASVLAVSTTKSALSFSDFQTALSTVAPVAKTFGFRIEDTVAMLGKLKDAGFDASSAATSTRNILLNLADSNGKLAKSLGGSITNFDELIPALVKLREKGVDLNETLQLTDKRSVAAFNQFLSGAESAKELRDGLIDVKGEMQEMVDTQLDNLTGDMKKLNSAWQGLILTVEEGNGVISKFFRGIVKGATESITILGGVSSVFKSLTDMSDEDASKMTDFFTNFTIFGKRLFGEFADDVGMASEEMLIAIEEKIASGETKLTKRAEVIFRELIKRRREELAAQKQLEELALKEEEERLEKSKKAKLAAAIESRAKIEIPEIDIEPIEIEVIPTVKTEDKLKKSDVIETAEEAEIESIWEQLGIKDEYGQAAVSGVQQTYGQIMETLSTFADQRKELTDAEVERADSEVDASEQNLNRQIQLAEMGYASNIQEAERQLALDKQTKQKALAEQQEALRQQQRLASIEQGVGLITASVNVLNTFSSIPIVGWALGIAAVGAMIAAFVGQKAAAKRATKTFGSGGYEEIGGGTHASGNDTTFAHNNGVDLKAERGESHGIFTPKATRKYGSRIEAFVNDANKLNLEERYSNAFNMGITPVVVENNSNFDSPELRSMNSTLKRIEKQGGEVRHTDRNGNLVIKKGNVTRRIKTR